MSPRLARRTQLAIEPGGGRASFKSDTLERAAEASQHGADRIRFGIDLAFNKDITILIDNTDVDGFQRYVETGEVFHQFLLNRFSG
jgi:hypothetical protein